MLDMVVAVVLVLDVFLEILSLMVFENYYHQLVPEVNKLEHLAKDYQNYVDEYHCNYYHVLVVVVLVYQYLKVPE